MNAAASSKLTKEKMVAPQTSRLSAQFRPTSKMAANAMAAAIICASSIPEKGTPKTKWYTTGRAAIRRIGISEMMVQAAFEGSTEGHESKIPGQRKASMM